MNQPTVYDFIAWCKNQVDEGALSSLMTRFGFQRDDVETIAEASQNPAFLEAFGGMVRDGISRPKDMYDISRATGEPTAIDWIKIANHENLNSGFDWPVFDWTLGGVNTGTGSNTSSTSSNASSTGSNASSTGSNGALDSKSLTGIAASAGKLFDMISSVFGKGVSTEDEQDELEKKKADKDSGGSSFTIIIIIVVVIVVVAILWLSLAKKK